MSALAGGIADPAGYNADTKKLLAWGKRESNSSTTTTETGVLRIDGIPTVAGRMYRVSSGSTLIFNSSVAADLVEARLYYDTTDTATTSSTQFGARAMEARSAGSSQFTDGIFAFLPSPGDGTMSVLLSVARTVGTGNVSINASSTYPCLLVIEDIGPDTGDVGVTV